jgi:hypothetical protein
MPKLASFSLHPEPVVNARGEIDMDPAILAVMLAGALGFTVLFFWLLGLGRRIRVLRRSAAVGE